MANKVHHLELVLNDEVVDIDRTNESEDALNDTLRNAFRSVLTEPIPPKMMELIRRLPQMNPDCK